MSVEVMTWVFKHSEVNVPGRRLVLLSLADRADPDGTRVFPSVERIARDTRMSERGVRYALRALEADGAILRIGANVEHNYTNEYAVVMTPAAGGAEIAPLQSATAEGGNLRPKGGATVAPKPSVEPSKEPSELRDARTDAWPDGLGSDVSTPEQVLAVLAEVAADHGITHLPLTRKAVGHIILAFPDRAHLEEAHAMASWFAEKTIKRVAPTYRNWLKNADPASNVTPMRSGKQTAPRDAASKSNRDKWYGWAAENVPELPLHYAVAAAQRGAYAGREVTPELVRAYVASLDAEEVSS